MRRQRVIKGEQALAETLDAFEGQLVAVRCFKVVDQADTLDQLLDRVDVDAVDRIFEVKALAPAVPLRGR